MDKAHNVEHVSFSGTMLRLRIDGKEYEIDVTRHSARLTNATPEQRSHFVVTPSGYGIHLPDLDEDLSTDGLIGVTHARVQTNPIA